MGDAVVVKRRGVSGTGRLGGVRYIQGTGPHFFDRIFVVAFSDDEEQDGAYLEGELRHA